MHDKRKGKYKSRQDLKGFTRRGEVIWRTSRYRVSSVRVEV